MMFIVGRPRSIWRKPAAMFPIHCLILMIFFCAARAITPEVDDHGAVLQILTSGWDQGCLSNMARLEDGQWVNGPWMAPVSNGGVAPFDHTFNAYNLFVDPLHQFAFCAMQKNACSNWIKMFGKLKRDDPDFAGGTDYYLPQKSVELAGSDSVAQLFSNPGAVRAVMIREPLARFVSAFLNKCFDASCGNGLCPRKQTAKGKAISFKTALEWVLESDPDNIDGHWGLQSAHCELNSRLGEYNLVTMMNKDSLGDDASCIMETAGIARFNVVGGGSTDRYWRSPNDTDPTAISDVGRTEEYVLKKLFSEHTADQFMRKFHKDYALFRLQPPEWIKEATGEWEDHLTAHCDKNPYAEFVQGPTLEEDEDDILKLAHAAGYFEQGRL